jgi:hypothetical protein
MVYLKSFPQKKAIGIVLGREKAENNSSKYFSRTV